MTRVIVLAALTAVGAASMVAAACRLPGHAAPAATEIRKVRGNLFVITGADSSNRDAFSGGNTGVFVTDTGVIVVDTKLAGWGQVLLDRIRTVTDKPVTTIVNTHTHADHTGSNSMFPSTVDIVAHENTRTNMELMDAFMGERAKFLPKRTFTNKLTLGAGKDRVDLYYFGRGHTDGDAWVVYPAVGVMQTGDMFPWKDAPSVDRTNGGSVLEYAGTIEKALETVKDVDTLIVGHSEPRTMAELREYQSFVMDFVAAVRQAKAAGLSVDDAAASIDLGSKYQGYHKARYRGAIMALYDELN